MASPFTAYFAGMGTVVAALAVGFGGGYMLTAPSPSQKEQASAFEKRVEAKPEKAPEPVRAAEPAPVNAPSPGSPELPVSPVITAAQTPSISTTFGSPVAPAPWPPMTAPPAVQSTAQEPPKPAPDPGMLQVPVRPAPPVEAAAPAPAQVATPAPVQRSREIVRSPETASGEWKKKKEKRDALAQKQRRQIEQARQAPREAEEAEEVIETQVGTSYAPAPRHPLGIFNILLGGGN